MVAPASSLLDSCRHATWFRGPTVLSVVALGCALLATGPAGGEPRRYEIDPVHTRVWFEADHSGFSKALGAFAAPRGVLWFDAKNPTTSSVEAEVALASLDLGDEDWNERVARKDFLWTAEHPIARFRSTRVETDGEGGLGVHGVLSLRGIEVPVTLHTQLNQAARHPLTLRQTIGFSAHATLSRAAFGMTSWKRLVDDAVLLRIELEAKRKRGDGRDEDDDEDEGQKARGGTASPSMPAESGNASSPKSASDAEPAPPTPSNSAPAGAVEALADPSHALEENGS